MFSGSFRPVFVPDHVIKDDPKSNVIKRVNQYALVEKIGYGGFSKVFLAIDTEKGTPYAAKAIVVDGRSNDGRGLQREIRIHRQLNHTNIVKLHEVLHLKKKLTAYLILEYASFGSLERFVSRGLDMPTIATIFKQVCAGLRYLHSKGITHRDVKPGNILLFGDGIAKLNDFGIGHNLTSQENFAGSPAYQAPEFFSDDCDVFIDPMKEDVWGLGVSLFEVAFGYLPFSGGTVYEIAHTILSEPLRIPDSAPPDLRDLLQKMLRANPEERISLDEVMEHEFFDQAQERFELGEAPVVPKLSTSKSMLDLAAQVCDENYNFSSARSNSWSGLRGQF